MSGISRGLDPGVLLDWCERLCAHPSADPREVVAGLGIPGTLSGPTGHFSDLVLDPPPPGTGRFVADSRGGELFSLELKLDGGTITHGVLTTHFGPGEELVRIHWDSPFVIGYLVKPEGAPFSCDLFASYEGDPPDDSRVPDEVVIRRQREMRAPRKKMPG